MDPLLEQVLANLRKQEGFVPKAQWDFRQNTNGYGTKALYPGEVIDRDEAERRLLREATASYNSVNKFAPNAPAGARAALTSLSFNAGDKWQGAGLGKAVQSGNMADAKNLFLQYNKAGGNVLPGLVRRRGEEAVGFDGDGPFAVANNSGAPTTQPSPQEAAPAAPFEVAMNMATPSAPASPGANLELPGMPSASSLGDGLGDAFAQALAPKPQQQKPVDNSLLQMAIKADADRRARHAISPFEMRV